MIDAAKGPDGGRDGIRCAPVVAIAGSIRFLPGMKLIRDALVGHGIIAELPLAVEPDRLDPIGQRRQLASRFMDILARKSTSALLLANYDCDGVAGYVGASAFAEAAVAFSRGKPIYLFSRLPEGHFFDELKTFGAIPLEGDLSRLVANLASAA